jgi:serine/threonine protein kinase
VNSLVHLDLEDQLMINASYNAVAEAKRLLRSPKLVHWKKLHQQLTQLYKSLNRLIKAEVTKKGPTTQSYAKDRLVEEAYEVDYNARDIDSQEPAALYSGKHRTTGERVQIRICDKDGPDLKHYLYEVETLQKMNHPNILKIMDIYQDDLYYIYVQNSTPES